MIQHYVLYVIDVFFQPKEAYFIISNGSSAKPSEFLQVGLKEAYSYFNHGKKTATKTS